MATTYALIQAQTLASNTAKVTFSSIPSTYTDLTLMVSGKSTAAQTFDWMTVTFNGDTSALYSYFTMRGTNTTVTSISSGAGVNSADPNMHLPGNTVTTNAFGSLELYIPNYASTNNKPFSSFGVGESNSATQYNPTMGIGGNLYSSTTAISSITVGTSASWLSGSTFYLYGIKNS